jgi:hypothetical protein
MLVASPMEAFSSRSVIIWNRIQGPPGQRQHAGLIRTGYGAEKFAGRKGTQRRAQYGVAWLRQEAHSNTRATLLVRTHRDHLRSRRSRGVLRAR